MHIFLLPSVNRKMIKKSYFLLITVHSKKEILPTVRHKTINDYNLPFLIALINNRGLLKKRISSVLTYNSNKHTNMDNRLYFVTVVYMVILTIANGKFYLVVSFLLDRLQRLTTFLCSVYRS